MKVLTIHDLNISKKGITLSLQHMDLIDIILTNSVDELKQLAYSLKNLLPHDLEQIFAYDKPLETLKQDCFHAYRSNLMHYSRYYHHEFGYLDNNIKYIEYIKAHYDLLDDEIDKLEELQFIKTRKKIIRFITKNFRPEIVRNIFDAQIEYMTIEKDGLKLTSYEHFEKLAREIKKYDIINCDEIASYRSVVTYDGRYNTYRLNRALQFAYKHNKKLRLDAVIFYLDTPTWVETLKNNSKNQEYIFNHLLGYIDKLITTVNEFNKNYNTDIVETITLLNEPLNRFPGPFEADYSPRKDVRSHFCLPHKKLLKSDNLRPGWLRLLSIEHICKLGVYIKTNSSINIMINECYLEKYRKMDVFINSIIRPIQNYEEQNNIKIIDIIGTQMHIDVDVPSCDVERSLDALSKLKIPYEVTEFDVFVAPDKIEVASHHDITLYKSFYVHDLYKIFENHSPLLQCVTIWSINDYMNFVVNKMNDSIYQDNIKREKQGLKPKPYLTNILGGYYDSHMNERLYLPEIG